MGIQENVIAAKSSPSSAITTCIGTVPATTALRANRFLRAPGSLGVADAYEAMVSARPHRPAMSKDQAMRELNRQAGVDFDPQVVSVVSEIVSS